MLDISSIIFFTMLSACVPLGYVYKNIEDVQKRGMLGTGVGVLIATGLCGLNVFYTVLLVLGNIMLMKTCDIRHVHKMSLIFTWVFLLYVYHHTKCTTYTAWLYQTMALRLVGLAFEINICDRMIAKPESKLASSSSKTPTPVPVDDSVTKLSPTDIATYAYFFLGIQRGPYYTWKTFNDHLNSTISKEGDFWVVTQQKLIKAVLLTLGCMVLRSKYPISMFEQDEFYKNYGTDYRFLICMPHLLIYYLQSQIMLMISTSACSAAGFGVYPVKAQAAPGAGPTKPVIIEGSTEKEEYNFSMLKCFDNEKILMGPKMKDTMRGWDMATRYWFSQYIVNNLITNNFEVRSACSFLVWTIWTGSAIQDLIIALTLWVYIHLESDYAQLYAESLTGPWNLGFAIMRIFCLFYLTPCFILEDRKTILRYYNSIYWIYHVVLAVLFLAAIAVHKVRTRVRINPDADEPPKLEPSVPPSAKSKTEDETQTKTKTKEGSKDETSSKPKTKEGTKDNEPSTSGNKGAT